MRLKTIMVDFMNPQPTLRTTRLILRPFTLADASAVQALVGDWQVARMTATVPHPYADGMAEAWIQDHAALWEARAQITYAICLASDELIGCVGLVCSPEQQSADLGYWIGQPYWGKGYCTEAARCILQFTISERSLRCITACHLKTNPASGAVLKKLGMTQEGTLFNQTRRDRTGQAVVLHRLVIEN